MTEARLAALRSAFRANAGPATAAPTIIVPIHDAFEDTVACLESVARTTDKSSRLLLINDGSRDPRVSRLLATLVDVADNLYIVDRPDNHGFVRTVNEGFALTPAGDVVILNSDTIVSPGWLERLSAVAGSRPDVATVTPLTNNGTICSVPIPLVDNALPAGYDADTLAAVIAALSLELFPEAPTGVGFCLLITRRALDTLGGFDTTVFGDGYGEENDFCQRALAAGLVNLIADHTFVYHTGRASFGARTPALLARNLERLAARYPDYHADVARFAAAHPLRRFHDYLGRALAAGYGRRGAPALRVLHLLHHGGGTEKHARDLAATDDPSMLSYVMLSDGRQLDVEEYHAGQRLRSLRFPLPVALPSDTAAHEPGYRAALATAGAALEIDVIHVHHLLQHTLDVADVAAMLAIPYVVTLHDYYVLCPRYTLLDGEGRACGACLEPAAAGAVDACLAPLGRSASDLERHQHAMATFLGAAARVFAPNASVREVVAARFADVAARLTVVEHGHRPGQAATPAPRRENGGALNVAVIGALDVHKGSTVLRELLRANRRRETTFHFYGTAPDPDLIRPPHRGRLDGSAFVYHGPYDAGDIVQRLQGDGIHVGLQLAVWPETFSYTVSEFVEAGVPIIAGGLGAQGERVRRCRLGWTVPDIRDVGAILGILDTLLDDPRVLPGVRHAMRRAEALPPIEPVWAQYAAAYREITAGRDCMPTTPPLPRDDDHQRRYVAALAMGMAEAGGRETVLQQRLVESEARVQALQQRLRSPRHRIADALGDWLQRIPVLWPLIARATEAALRRQERRQRARA